MIRCHSIHWEPTFLGESSALAAATILQTEILGWGFDAPLRTSKHSETHDLHPILRREAATVEHCHRKVIFQNFAEVFDDCFPPVLKPHSDLVWIDAGESRALIDPVEDYDFVSLMARAPQAARSRSSSSFVDSDLETHMPTSPSSFDEQHVWVSAQVYDLKSNHAHGRVRILPREANFAELRRLLGYTHHSVADIFNIQPPPSDLQNANISPFLILAQDDLLHGDHRKAVLIDVELHGASIESTIEIDRYTTLLPSPIHRSLLLRIAGVSKYCAMRKNRCLVWHRGILIPLQQANTIDLQHGDHLRIAVPPFEPEHISTYYAIRACQHGLTQRQIVHSHQRNPDADDLFSEVEAAQRNPDERQDHDSTALLQLSQNPLLPNEWSTIELHKSGECAAPHFTAQAPDTFQPREVPQPDDEHWPSWYSSLHRSFQERAATACEEEGPIAFITTWFLRGPGESVSEESRVLRLDQYHDLWRQDLVELWNDKINRAEALHIDFVHPEPPRHDTSWTIGHVILHQGIDRPFVPVLLAINFITNGRTGINHAAAVLLSPTNAFRVRDLCRLGRVCIDRHFELRDQDQVFQHDDPVHPRSGQCLIFCIHPPVIVHHIGEDQIVTPQWYTMSSQANPAVLEAQPILTDQSEFTQQLFEHWEVHARVGPGNLERLLHVSTWCLHADRLRMNDEVRQATFGDDFHLWETQLQRIWQDLLEPIVPVDFAIVWHPPESEYDASRIHVIVHQRLQPNERANIVTMYDDTVLNNIPYSTAVILPNPVSQTALLQAVHRVNDCPPVNPYTVCTTWQRGIQFNDVRQLRCHHGMTFMLIINWNQHATWTWDDQDDPPSMDATSSISMLQINSQLVNDRRQTAGQVAHTQRPATELCLDALIEPPQMVKIDFSEVLRLADEFRHLAHHFNQTWPCDLEIPAETVEAFTALIPLPDLPPIAYHFYTDGSKNASGNVGSGIVMLIQTVQGWHYGGCLSCTIKSESTSIYGEHGAIIWALLWAHHISDTHWQTFGTAAIEFSFNFDATVSGYSAAGYWRTPHALPWRTLMRSIAQVLQTRHGFHRLAWNHIKAHCGHPWNESADALAKYAAEHPEHAGSSIFWEDMLQNPTKLCAVQWLWYKELLDVGDPRVPFLENGHVVCIVPTIPENSQPKQFGHQADFTSPIVIPMNITLATANIMTMDQYEKTSSISRQMILMQQFHSAGCHIVGVQETRHRHITGASNEFYHIFGHPADARGQDGIQLWISKTLPVGSECGPFGREHVRIVASAPNLIVAKLRINSWSCIVISCRAPHSGRPRSEAVAFWSNINGILQRFANQLPVFFCGDANAHLGEVPSSAVGQLYATNENQAGQFFHEWMLCHELFAPSTFEAWHQKTASATHVSPNGHEVRIDYVALPRMLHFKSIKSWVSEDIDLSITRYDHNAVLCQIEFDHVTTLARKPLRSFQPDVQDLANNLQHDECLHYLHSAIYTSPWCVDPHTSATQLASTAFDATRHLAHPRSRWRRKSHISEATWALVERKKHLFKQIKSLKRTLRFTIVQACFSGWKQQKQQQGVFDHIACDLPRWLILHDHATAITQLHLQTATDQARAAIREEDTKLYQSIAEQTNRVYTAEGLTMLWKQLRALLPKHRNKSHQVHRDIDEDLQRHFERLEAGSFVDKEQLRSSCLVRNQSELEQQVICQYLRLEELPTLVEVENLCLKQRPRKAPGPDCVPADLCRHGATAVAPHLHSVLCKSLIYGIEPFDFKGGRLCAIFKGKGDPDDPAGYRGILLSNTFAKIGHAWARQKLLPTLLQRKTLGQLGGFHHNRRSQESKLSGYTAMLHNRSTCRVQSFSST